MANEIEGKSAEELYEVLVQKRFICSAKAGILVHRDIIEKLQSWCNVYLDKAKLHSGNSEVDLVKCQAIVIEAVNDAIANLELADILKSYLKQLIHSNFQVIVDVNSKKGSVVTITLNKRFSSFKFQEYQDETQQPKILVLTWQEWMGGVKEQIRKELKEES